MQHNFQSWEEIYTGNGNSSLTSIQNGTCMLVSLGSVCSPLTLPNTMHRYFPVFPAFLWVVTLLPLKYDLTYYTQFGQSNGSTLSSSGITGSGGIKEGGGGMGAFAPPSWRLYPPLAPQSEGKKWPKSAIFGNFFGFLLLLKHILPPRCPPQKVFWCHHW